MAGYSENLNSSHRIANQQPNLETYLPTKFETELVFELSLVRTWPMANDHIMIGDIPDKEFGKVICNSH